MADELTIPSLATRKATARLYAKQSLASSEVRSQPRIGFPPTMAVDTGMRVFFHEDTIALFSFRSRGALRRLGIFQPFYVAAGSKWITYSNSADQPTCLLRGVIYQCRSGTISAL
jgi:hypothetical protein